MFSPSWYFIVTLKYLFYTIFTGLLIWVFKLILFLPWFEGIRCLFLLSLSWNETKNLFAFGVSQQLSMCVIVNPISRPPWGGQIYVSSFQSSNRTQFSILRWEISRIYHLVFKVKGGGGDYSLLSKQLLWPPCLYCSILGSAAKNMQRGTISQLPAFLFYSSSCFLNDCGMLRALESPAGGQFLGKTVDVAQLPHWTDLRSKAVTEALAGEAQWIGHQPMNQRVTGSIPCQGICLGFGPGPQQRAHERQPHIAVSLPLFLPPFPFLKINK